MMWYNVSGVIRIAVSAILMVVVIVLTTGLFKIITDLP
jgi:hypothetical protein